MAKKAALAFALALLACIGFSQGNGGGLIEDHTWAFLVSAPPGWILDGKTLRIHGIQGLFYKEGTRYSPSELNMYISPSQKKPGGPANLGDFIATDEATYMKSKPGTEILDLAAYAPGMGYNFVLRDFDDRNEGYYQSLAFYEGEDAFFVFVLSCRSVAERQNEQAAFHSLLDSFTYVRKE